jgi:uncharacterized membrane-anchored protein
MAEKKHHEITRGLAYADVVTKRLLRHITPGSIAVIRHDDLDELAAVGLVQAGVKAVVNAGQTMSGKIPLEGPLRLLERNIPVVEIAPLYFPLLQNRTEVCLLEGSIAADGLTIPCIPFTKERWYHLYYAAASSQNEQLREFIDNTLKYAQIEKDIVLQPLVYPKLRTVLAGRHVLIVIRGKDYRQDLAVLRKYINRQRPALIGVDGGADCLLEHGYTPDIIVGDMDSVSDRALQCGAELVVHAYRSGQAPGLARLSGLGLPAFTLASCGTSEDLALLLAYDLQCARIVTIGLHSHMNDYLEKGRQGMGSSLLVRMKVGDKLTDAKGIRWIVDSGTLPWRNAWPQRILFRFPFSFGKLFMR